MPSSKIIKKQDDIDFEIRFIEGVLKENPNFVEGLTILGDLYTKKGLYEKGLEVDEKLARLCPDDSLVHYNLACSYSLVQNIEKSLETIKRAVALGYSDFDYLKADHDLVNLRQDSRFQEFFLKLQASKNR